MQKLKKLITSAIYSIFGICGIFQCFLIPGLIWNVVFPFAQILLFISFLLFWRENKYLKICTLMIFMAFSAAVVLDIKSDLNTSSDNYGQEIKIMSYNLFFKNRHPNNSISIIKKEDPDILFVQELTPKWKNILDNAFEKKYKYKLTKSLKGTHGIGIYSKYKISNQKFLNNSANKPYAQIVDLEIKNKKMQLINTHLASPAVAVENKEQFFSLYYRNYLKRKKQILNLNKIAQKSESTYKTQILVGDLNTLQSEPIFRELKLEWANSISHPLRWMKFNFPNSGRTKPFLTLDFILARGNIKFIDTKIIKGGSSDHLPILSKIKI